MKLFSIKDTKVGFMTPFQHHSEATAIRDVANAVNAPERNAANENLPDKELWLLGEFNANTGEIKQDIKFICRHSDLKKGVGTNGRPSDRGNTDVQKPDELPKN